MRGSGAALQGAALIPPCSAACWCLRPASGTVSTFPSASCALSPQGPAISSSAPLPSCPAPHPSSSLRDDPGLGSLPAHPRSVSSVHLCRQVRTPCRASRTLLPSILPGLGPGPVGMFHPHQAPSTCQGQAFGPAVCTAVRPAVCTGMTLPQGAGKAALPRDVGRGAAHRVDVSARLTRQGQLGSRSLDPFSPSLTLTRLCSHPRCPSIGLALVSRAGVWSVVTG